ncbi:MAG: PilC/PilY family type IV pilus protein [Betaproteobacteria bacterium]
MRLTRKCKQLKTLNLLPGVFALLAIAVASPMLLAQTLATVPIPALSSGVNPVPTNLTFIIDDSTSMNKEWVGDSLRNTTGVGSASLCRGYLLPNLGESPELNTLSCFMGDPPINAANINKVFYNPMTKYPPPVDWNGTNTTYGNAMPTAVRTDAYNLASAAAPINLTTQYPESVFCDSKTADPTDKDHCKQNGKDASNYQLKSGGLGYPNAAFPYQKYRYGAPYYYNVSTVEWCKDRGLRQCGSAVKTGPYVYEAYARACNSTAAVNLGPGAVAEWTYIPGVAPPSNVCQASYVSFGSGNPFNFTHGRYGSFTRVDIDPADTVEMGNFANWYAYYRNRVGVVKAALGLGLQKLDKNARVGYMGSSYGLSGGLPTASPVAQKFLPVQTFDATGRQNFYTKIYGSPYGTSTTNLHSPLALTGMYYAGVLTGLSNFKYKDLATGTNKAIPDPIVQSCQANYAVLVTDGIMIQNAGGFKVDGVTNVGNQDGPGTPAPYCEACKSGLTTSNTLADVAQYYRTTDLRPSMIDNVPTSSRDKAKHQHMTTFTLGVGVAGNFTYVSSYETDATSDYQQILNENWDWPVPVLNTATTVDDLWHAAVNGGGFYRVTGDLDSTTKALNSIVSGLLKPSDETAAGVTVSSPNFSNENNTVIISSFRTPDWYGDLKKIRLDKDTGKSSNDPSMVVWSAAEKVDVQAVNFSARKIYMPAAGSTPQLKNFSWATLDPATEQPLFDPAMLSIYSSLNASQQSSITGPKLVDFLRGDRSNEAPNNDAPVAELLTNAFFRNRTHVLGDIASSEAVIVDIPDRGYVDPGYQAFKTATVRTATAYVGANDGMLHAFNANTGAESWAFIPSMVTKNLYKLANRDYSTNHQFFVDGSPATADICVSQCGTSSAVWKTVLVSGLNAGGRGFFALDITGDIPKLLWEFSAGTNCIAPGGTAVSGTRDCDLGYSFGNPVITKLGDGRWVVLLTSGYVNGDTELPKGSGKGYLYMLDATTGDILKKISTGVGTPASPSGLAKISAWAEVPDRDNTALRVYGGDVAGNFWRFEDASTHTLTSAAGATLLAEFKAPQSDGTTKPQPVTIKPELGKVGTNAMVYVGTGRLLGPLDLSDTVQQSFYGIKDQLGASLGDVHNNGKLVKQTLQDHGATRDMIPSTVDLAVSSGWYFDFNPANSSPGERMVTDPTLNLGTLAITTHVPPKDVCTEGSLGNSFHYFVGSDSGNAVAESFIGMASRPVVVRGDSGNIISLVRSSSKMEIEGTNTLAFNQTNMVLKKSGRRVSWREILTK